MKKENNFERSLPDGYREALVIDAKSAKVGVIFNVVAFLITIVVFFVAVVLIGLHTDLSSALFDGIMPMLLTLYIVLMIAYVILHELTHGVAYKCMTGEKLTFGLTLTVAFCGVPNIYVYRKPVLVACAAPFVVFSAVYLALMAVLYFVSVPFYLLISLMFALHLGGCVGDIYAILLLLFKFKDADTLIRDTGPVQTFYVKE